MDYFEIISRQNKTESLLFKMEQVRMDKLRRIAEAAGVGMSEWLRRAIDDAPESPASADSR